MNSDILFQIFQAAKDGTEETQSVEALCKQICEKHGIHTPFTLQFKNLDGTDNAPYDIILNPGDPVIVTLNDRYLLECLMDHRSPLYFKSRLTQAMERLYRMHRTLRHLIPLNTAIALKKEAKTWFKIPAPMFEQRLIRSKQLAFEYTLKISHALSNTSVTLAGNDPNVLKQEGLHRISTIIFENAELMDLLDDIESMRTMDVANKPSEIKLGGVDGEIRETRKY